VERIRTLQHLGKEILVLDYSGLAAEAYMPVARLAMKEIARRPEGSLLTITNVKGTRFSVGTTEDIKRYSEHNRPYVKASAVVGLSPMQRVVFLAVKPFLTQTIATFDDVPSAMAWLVARP
jgi:hypothetical protein